MSPEPTVEPLRPGRVAARLARQVELALGDVELTLAQYRLLFFLDEGKVPASALAEKLAVSRPSVTAVVDGLVARGLVERGHEADDRRRVDHALTPEGRRVLTGADAAVERRLAAIAECHPGHHAHGAPPGGHGHVHRHEHVGEDGMGAGESTDVLAGLESWREALDASRAAKHAALVLDATGAVAPGAMAETVGRS